MDQTSIHEGIGGTVLGSSSYKLQAVGDTASFPAVRLGLCNVRQKHIQGLTTDLTSDPTIPAHFDTSFFKSAGVSEPGARTGLVGNEAPTPPVTRRYQVQLMLGLLMQEKYIPTKWMASQLAIEIYLERAEGCMYCVGAEVNAPGIFAYQNAQKKPTYGVTNVQLIPEILQFDSSYDTMFLQGLKTEGVPIKFSSWHTNLFSINSNNVSLNIQERSRSVKAMFALQKRQMASFGVDNGATFFDTSTDGLSSLQTFQFRLGGRYYPAAPVQCASTISSSVSNGGAEAYVELAKALNILGDYRLSSGCNIARWAIQPAIYHWKNGSESAPIVEGSGLLSEFDYSFEIIHTDPTTGRPHMVRVENADSNTGKHNSFCGSIGSACFGMAINLETSNGLEISGLNGEEQSDFQLIAQWKGEQRGGAGSSGSANLLVFSYFDAMLILRENNVIELIQ